MFNGACIVLFPHSFAGQTLSSKSQVLITYQVEDNPKLTVSCDKMIIGSMLLTELKDTLKER